MTTTLTPELYWLVLTTLMTSLMWVPYIINRLQEQGFGFALRDPQGETRTQITWAARAMRAHANAIENLVIFATLVLTLHVVGINNDTTVTACVVYFFSRALHYVVFTLGIPMLRIPVFVVNYSALLTLALVLLGII